MKYDFNIPIYSYEASKNITDVDGKEVLLSSTLATRISSSGGANTMKLMYWAIKLFDRQVLELDEVDTKLLKEFIEQDQMLIHLVKYQLLKILEG